MTCTVAGSKASGTLNGRHNAVTLDTSGSLSRLDIATALAATAVKADAHRQRHRGLAIAQPGVILTDELTLRCTARSN